MPTPSFATVTAPGATPRRWMLFLHGILGSGANWRTIAKRLLEARPEWGAALVDLRNHGQSQAFEGPHTLLAAAADLEGVAAALPGPVDAILGHSYGGKVTMEAVRRRQGDLAAAWILDSSPSRRPDGRGSEDVLRVVAALKRLPTVLESREAFHAELEAQGFSLGLRQWLAMNVRPEGSGYRFRIDLDAVDEMLADYFERDYWDLFETPPGRVRLDVVLGGRSSVCSDGDQERFAAAAAARPDRVHVHVLPDAGHWVHSDDPEGVLRLLIAELPPAP